MSNISSSVQIAASYDHNCARFSDGSLKCWGRNNYGQLGDNSTIDNSTAVSVLGSDNFTDIAGGLYHTCGVLSGGGVKCWGYNGQGQIGDNSTTWPWWRQTPVAVTGLSGAQKIAAGENHNCALLSGGSVKCWGQNDVGQLGDNNSSYNTVTVIGLSNAAEIGSGVSHSCARLDNGSVQCWGGVLLRRHRHQLQPVLTGYSR